MGRELRQTRTLLHELCAVVVGIYGGNNRAAFNFQKATEAIDRLRIDLQAQAAEDLPEENIDGIYL
jgi:hypothetical protein